MSGSGSLRMAVLQKRTSSSRIEPKDGKKMAMSTQTPFKEKHKLLQMIFMFLSSPLAMEQRYLPKTDFIYQGTGLFLFHTNVYGKYSCTPSSNPPRSKFMLSVRDCDDKVVHSDTLLLLRSFRYGKYSCTLNNLILFYMD